MNTLDWIVERSRCVAKWKADARRRRAVERASKVFAVMLAFPVFVVFLILWWAVMR